MRAVARKGDDDGGRENPSQHHESTAASRDRAYHIAREGGLPRDVAKQVAHDAVERARRNRGA
jgi:hypothetical protein